jgi:hypothetical protein
VKATKKFSTVDTQNKIAITTQELQSLLGCGRRSATQIGELAEAKIQFGRRVLWNVEKVKIYINSISC